MTYKTESLQQGKELRVLDHIKNLYSVYLGFISGSGRHRPLSQRLSYEGALTSRKNVGNKEFPGWYIVMIVYHRMRSLQTYITCS